MSPETVRLWDRIRVRVRNAAGEVSRLVRSEKFPGECTVCGRNTFFLRHGKNLRETFVCRHCGSVARHRHLSKVLQEALRLEPPLDLRRVCATCPDLRVFEAGSVGCVHEALASLRNYVCSEYFGGVPRGEQGPRGVRCEDLQRLTFPDESFDLVISQDVFEHVREPDKAWQEIARVLRPGGLHVFTIPFDPRRDTIRRIEIVEGRELRRLPPVYHLDPVRGGLVYTDFGRDLPLILERHGFSTTIHWCTGADGQFHAIYWACTFVSVKG